MADKSDPIVFSALFRLGGLLTGLAYWLEHAWLSDQTDKDAALFGRVQSQVTSIETLTNGLQDSTLESRAADELKRLADSSKALVKQFNLKWGKLKWGKKDRRKPDNKNPIKHVRKSSEVDPEFVVEVEQREIEKLLLEMPSWAYWKQVQAGLEHKLNRDHYACIILGQMLEIERHPTFSDKVRTFNDEEWHVYFAGDFNERLKKHMASLFEEFPHFQDLDYDLSKFSGRGVTHAINDLRNAIRTGLLNPPPLTPGYLGLILDKSRGWIKRGDIKVDLNGKIVWDILRFLEKRRDDFSSREMLREVWRDAIQQYRRASAVANPNSLDVIISALRKKLKRLGVTIHATRNEGWRLEEVTPDESPRPKRRKTKSRRYS